MRSDKSELCEIDGHNSLTFDRRFVRVAAAIFLFVTFLLFVPDSFAAKTYTIAVIGTGNMGSALGKQFAGAGHRILYGSRDSSRDKVKKLVEVTGHAATATSQREAAQRAEIVVLAVPWGPMEEIVKSIGNLSGKIVIDISTANHQADDGYLEVSVDSSTSELIQQWAPGARVVKTPFSAAEIIENPSKHGEPTVTYIAADDRNAKEIVAGLAMQLNLFPLDAGPLRMAKSIEHLGLLYLTPLVQGRETTWIWVPRVAVDYSCISTEGWFRPVKDADDLASFSNLESADRQCPSK